MHMTYILCGLSNVVMCTQAMLGVTDDDLPSMPAALLRYSSLIKDTGRVLSVLSNPPELSGHGSGTVVKESSEAGLLLQQQVPLAVFCLYRDLVCLCECSCNCKCCYHWYCVESTSVCTP